MQARNLWILAAIGIAAGSARAMTAEELIAKNIEARGGMDKLKAIQTLRLEGKRLRAVLLLEAYRACGGSGDAHELAASVEDNTVVLPSGFCRSVHL